MRISVVVPAYNEERLLGESLACIDEALGVFRRAGWDAELIVCDNNSSDGTGPIARALGATVVFEPVNQIARARNTGARAATGDWLVFIDADSFPPVALFEDLLSLIAQGKAVGGGSTLAFEAGPLWGKLATLCWNAMSRTLRWASGAFIFCEARAFREVGGFNEALYASEELDLSRRLKRLARREGRSVEILRAHPLRTSERKLHLYSFGDFLRLFFKTVFTFGRTLRRREDLHIWYDGRR